MSHLTKKQRVKPSGALFAKALALGLVLIFFGCESEPPQKAAQTVVRKKIGTSAESGKAAKADTANKATAQTTAKKKAPQGQPAKPAPKKVPQATAPPAPAAEKPNTKPAAGASAKPEASGKAAVDSAAQRPSGEKSTPEGMQVHIARRPPLVVVDPFEPLFREEKPEKKPPADRPERKRRVPQTPLEKIDLGQLKLTAIFRTPGGNKALVEEASGKGYIVEKGTWIGVHAGQVKQITDEAVVVEEEVENAIGEVSLAERELKLQKPPGE